MPQVALLVDDEQTLPAYVSAILRQVGFSVLEAADGKEALSIVQRVHGSVDILVTDVGMPHMTGIGLVRLVKTDFPEMPVVYISGESLREGLHNPRAHIAFVPKPFAHQTILDAISTVIVPGGVDRRKSLR
jgi:two-component system cell cycle sensor histidine kinase/response regulator CckA